MAFLDPIKNILRSSRGKKDPAEELSQNITAEEHKNQENDEDPMAISNNKKAEEASLLHTKPPQAYGLKKNLTIALICILATIFLGSFLFGLDKPKPVTGDMANPSPAQTGSLQSDTINKLPGSYQDLAKYNTGKQQQPPAGTVQNQPGYAAAQQYNTAAGQRAYSQIPSNYPAYNDEYYQNGGPLPLGGGYMEKIADYVKSPIRFAIASAAGASDDSGENQGTATKAATKSLRPTYASMVEPQPYTLQAGTMIPATLITGIHSDLSGEVVAQVRQNVYDSVTGHYLLIPQGSRIVGEYSGGKVGYGQTRVSVAWKVLYLPNGASTSLDNMSAVDSGGYPGMQDQVNKHSGRIIRSTLLTSILAAGAQMAAGNTSTEDQTSAQAAVSGAAANLMNAGSKLIDRDINLSPTLIIRPGHTFNVFVNKDLVLQPYQ